MGGDGGGGVAVRIKGMGDGNREDQVTQRTNGDRSAVSTDEMVRITPNDVRDYRSPSSKYN